MKGLKSVISRIFLWFGIAAFCAAIAVACSVSQTAQVQAEPPAAQALPPQSPPPQPKPAAQPARLGTAAQRGLDYARAACADCHQVEPNGAQPAYSGAPAFHKAATWPGMTSIAMLAWLHTSHPTMPNLVIPRDRLDDLLAYFDYLREAGRQKS